MVDNIDYDQAIIFRAITDWHQGTGQSYLPVNRFKKLGNSADRKSFYGLCYKNVK